MNLDNIAKEFFSFQTVYICLAVYVVTYLIRRVLDGTWKVLLESGKVKSNNLANRIWSEILLPVIPIIVGGAMGLMAKSIVWPDITNGTRGGRILYGAICGMFSAYVFARIRAFLKSGSATTTEDSIPPEKK